MDLNQSDTPIESSTKDFFNRGTFAKRIAYAALNHNRASTLNIGLFGKWGEGKTSVLNLIKEELVSKSDEISILEFNPWLFPSENELLLHFFKEIAKTIDKKLYKDSEKTIQAVLKYGIPVLKTLGSKIEYKEDQETFSSSPNVSGLSLLNDILPDSKDLYLRLSEAIQDSNKRLLVIVDDVDRLEKRQIQALFRVLKLLGEFPKTTYILTRCAIEINATI